MVKEDADRSDALARTGKFFARAGVVASAIVAFLGGLAAIKFSGATREVRLPLWVFIVFVLALVGGAAFAVIFMFFEARGVWDDRSYWRSEALNLRDVVSRLEYLAYHDPITGLPNTNALERELSTQHGDRCLILLDLRDFKSVNDKHHHWKGDEYLRTFSSMILSESRRNEFIYKKRRPTKESAAPADEVKAFRRSEGGDEFYILLRGTVIDGLGYLNRLFSRSKEFDEMAQRVLGARHPFGFRAGVIALGKGELFAPAAERVSEVMGRTKATGSQFLVDWGRIQGDDRTPVDFDDPRFQPGTMDGNILATARRHFTVEPS